jgi:hypothetical protein
VAFQPVQRGSFCVRSLPRITASISAGRGRRVATHPRRADIVVGYEPEQALDVLLLLESRESRRAPLGFSTS